MLACAFRNLHSCYNFALMLHENALVLSQSETRNVFHVQYYILSKCLFVSAGTDCLWICKCAGILFFLLPCEWFTFQVCDSRKHCKNTGK